MKQRPNKSLKGSRLYERCYLRDHTKMEETPTIYLNTQLTANFESM